MAAASTTAEQALLPGTVYQNKHKMSQIRIFTTFFLHMDLSIEVNDATPQLYPGVMQEQGERAGAGITHKPSGTRKPIRQTNAGTEPLALTCEAPPINLLLFLLLFLLHTEPRIALPVRALRRRAELRHGGTPQAGRAPGGRLRAGRAPSTAPRLQQGAGCRGRAAMALLPLILVPLTVLPAVLYLCCGRRHTGSAAAVLQRREPGRPAARSPPRDTVS